MYERNVWGGTLSISVMYSNISQQQERMKLNAKSCGIMSHYHTLTSPTKSLTTKGQRRRSDAQVENDEQPLQLLQRGNRRREAAVRSRHPADNGGNRK